MPLDHPAHARDLLRVFQPLDPHHLDVDPAGKITGLIENVSDTARHPGAEIAPGGAEHHDAAARHVLAAMVSDRFHHRIGAAIAHREALARHAADVGFAAGRAVEPDV